MLLERIGKDNTASPADSSGDTSGLLSLEEDCDVLDSPKTQACKCLLQNSHAMWRTQRQLTQALFQVLLKEKSAQEVLTVRRGSLPSSQPESEAVPEGSPENVQVEQSTCLTDEAEPAREPQPQESPRDAAVVCETENDAVASMSDLASHHSDSPSVDVERSTSSVDDSIVACAPRPGEEGIPRSQALLPQLQQYEMNRELRIVVPDGMDADTRQVSFTFENKQHTVRIPENFEVGMEVPITISKRPALEKDRCSIWDSLRHGARLVGEERDFLNSQEFKHRQFLYSLLRGNAMHPLLPWTPEEEDIANISA